MGDYAAWRISYQSSEQAARAAYTELAALRARIEAAPVVQVVETGGRLIATSSPNDHSVTVGQRVALLPVEGR